MEGLRVQIGACEEALNEISDLLLVALIDQVFGFHNILHLFDPTKRRVFAMLVMDEFLKM